MLGMNQRSSRPQMKHYRVCIDTTCKKNTNVPYREGQKETGTYC